MAYIEFKDVHKSFDNNHVLKSINLKVEKGDFVTLLGPSGCGKSTLLRCLAGLEDVSEGQIFLDGKNITDVKARNRNIGMVFQQYSLFPNMTVEENIAFGLKMQKKSKEEIRQRVKEVIEIVELNGKEKQLPERLSGGQQQRVALARSIVQQPKVLLLDEPLSAIDAKLRKSLQIRIREIHETLGLTTIFVTHDQDEAMLMSDMIHLFNDGKIEQSGDPITMYTAPVNSFAASFIGNYNHLSCEEFERMTGQKTEAEHGVVLRPETVQILKEDEISEDEYILEGIIVGNRPRGNVLQYIVDVKGILLTVDVLFRHNVLFANGTKIRLSIADEDCIRL
ncbi:MAG: ABC transporter ATP-binding protein [Roseburia sp.]